MYMIFVLPAKWTDPELVPYTGAEYDNKAEALQEYQEAVEDPAVDQAFVTIV